MSNKQITNAVRAANSFSKDVSGNFLAGQEMRVFEYLRMLRAVLDGLQDRLETGSDFKAEQKLEAIIAAADAKMDEMTPFDDDLMVSSLEKWEKKGITVDMLLGPQT